MTTTSPGLASDGKRAELGELTGPSPTELTWTTLTVDGKPYPKALIANNSCYTGDSFSIEYQLSKRYMRFHATVGIDDLAQTGTTATFTVLVDGVKKDSKTVVLFETQPIDVPLNDARRMVISISVQSSSCFDDTEAGFIDPYVIAVSPKTSQPSATRMGH